MVQIRIGATRHLTEEPGELNQIADGAFGVGDTVRVTEQFSHQRSVKARPTRRGDERWYAATGAMGHAVVTYGLGSGSLWTRIQSGGRA